MRMRFRLSFPVVMAAAGCSGLLGIEQPYLVSPDGGQIEGGVEGAAGPDGGAGADGPMGTDSSMGTDSGAGTDGGIGTDGSNGDSGPSETGTMDSGVVDSGMSDGAPCSKADAGTANREWAQWPMPNSAVEVEAGAPNLEWYMNNGDGTVTDNVTGLMWQYAPAPGGGNYTQPNAIAYCAGLMLASHCDWRLPTYIELLSIVDFGQDSPAINDTYFPNSNGYFWSSTAFVGGISGNGWVIDFGNGGDHFHTTGTPNSVRCVR